MRSLALFASAWLLLAPAARGGSHADAAEPAVESPSAHDDGRRTLRRFPANLLRGAAGVFHPDTVGPFRDLLRPHGEASDRDMIQGGRE